jgi:hypothetical protein
MRVLAGEDWVMADAAANVRERLDLPFGTTSIETARGVGYRMGSG